MYLKSLLMKKIVSLGEENMWFAKTETGKYFDLWYNKYIDNIFEEMDLVFQMISGVKEIDEEVSIYMILIYILIIKIN